MILAYQGQSFWPSKIIRWMSWSKYSHVAWITQEGKVIEAWPPKVRILPDGHRGHQVGTKVDMFEVIDITPEQRVLVEKFLLNQVGKPYDWASVFRFIPRRNSERKTSGKWFCSEIIFKALLKANIKLFSGIEAYKVTPGMLVTSPRLRYVSSYKVRK